MAPEAMLGARDVDHEVDVYAAGIALLELTTGRSGPGAPDEKVDLDGVDPRILDVVAKSTGLRAGSRSDSAGVMARELARARPKGLFRRVFGRR